MASLRQQYYQTYLEFKQSDAFKSLSAEERAQIQKAAKQTYQELSDREKPAPTGQEIRDERGVLSNVVTDLTAGAVSLGRSGVSAAAWGADIAGLPDAAKALDEKSKQMGETSQMISPPADPNRLMSFGSQAVLQNAPTLVAGGVLTKLLTGSATGGAILNNLRNAAGVPAMAGAAPLTEGAASLISSTGLYGIPAIRQANVESGGEIRAGNPYMELAAAVPYAMIENTIGITPLKTMRAFSGSAAPAGIVKTLAANAGKLSAILEKPLFELSGKAGIRGMIGAFSRFVGENMLGESTEEIFQAIEETAIPHFTKKPIDQAIRDTLADLGKPEVVDLLTQAKGGALVGGVLGGGNAIARRLTTITEEINNPETTPEEAQRLASLKKQYREQPVLQLPYDQSIPTVQPSGPVIDDAVITSFRPETERVSTPQEILFDRTTEGTDRDYAAYQQEKQAKKEQPTTPISLAKKWLEVRNLPDSDPKKQKIMKLMSDRGLLAPEPMEYPKGPEGKKLRALDDAEVMPENLVSAEIAPETPMLEFQQNKAEGRALADEGGVILPIKTTDAITLKSGKPFASEKAAKGYQAKNSLKESHDVVPVRGGFVLMKKSEPGDVRRVTVETPRGGTYDKMDIRVEGTTVPTNRMKLSGTSDAAARIEKRLTQNVNENVTQSDPIPATDKQSLLVGKEQASNISDPADVSKFDATKEPSFNRTLKRIESSEQAGAKPYILVNRKLDGGRFVFEAYSPAGQLLARANSISGKGSISEKFYNRKDIYDQASSFFISIDKNDTFSMDLFRKKAAEADETTQRDIEAADKKAEPAVKQSEPAAEPKAASAEPKQQEAIKQPVTKSAYKTESYQGGFRVLDPQGKQYSWHTSKQAAENRAGEMNGTKQVAEKAGIDVKDMPVFELPEWLAKDETAQRLAASTGKVIDLNMDIGRGTVEKILPPSQKYSQGAVVIRGYDSYEGKKLIPGKRDTIAFVFLRDRIKKGESRLLGRDGTEDAPAKPTAEAEKKAPTEAKKTVVEPTRLMADVKIGEVIKIYPPKSEGSYNGPQYYGEKSPNQYNGTGPYGIVVKINTKSVQINTSEGKKYLVDKNARASNDLTDALNDEGRKSFGLPEKAAMVQAEEPAKDLPATTKSTVEVFKGDDITFQFPDGRTESAYVMDATPKTVNGIADQIYVKLDANGALRYMPKSWITKVKPSIRRQNQMDAERVETKNAATEPEAPVKIAASRSAAPTKAKADNIEDFGEKLGGAKKDIAGAALRDLSDDDLRKMTLSQIWPKEAIDKIEQPRAAAFATAARAEIPAKPRRAYALDRWVEKVKAIRSLIERFTADPKGTFKRAEDTKALSGFITRVLLLEKLPRESWGRIKNVELYPNAYGLTEDGQEVLKPVFRVEIDGFTYSKPGGTLSDVVDFVKSKIESQQPSVKMEFEVRGRDGIYKINKKGDPLYRALKTFSTAKEALAFRASNHSDLVQEWQNLKERENVSESDVRRGENRIRSGEDYRKGKDITPDDFSNAFGFRGIEFGNWVGQGKNQKERQGMLNIAYDSFMDLAKILGVPPKALSLSGSLGIGFGSRGHGRASAHFEPDTIVINLTKTKGAGSLAHEWFHALDNYFSRKRGGEKKVMRFEGADEYRNQNFITHKPEPIYVHKDKKWAKSTLGQLQKQRKLNPDNEYYNPDNWQPDPMHPKGVRTEVERAFANLVNIMNESPMTARSEAIDKSRSSKYWSSTLERAARAFEVFSIESLSENGAHNDYLANVISLEDFQRDEGHYPYLLPGESAPVKQAFKELFKTVKSRETQSGIELYSVEYLAAKYTAKAVKAGWRLIKSGVIKFADWAREMLKQFGKSIGSKLRAMYADLQALNAQMGKRGMIRMGSMGKPGFQKMAVVSNEERRFLRFEEGAVYFDDATFPTPRTIIANQTFLSGGGVGSALMDQHKNRNARANRRFREAQTKAFAELVYNKPEWQNIFEKQRSDVDGFFDNLNLGKRGKAFNVASYGMEQFLNGLENIGPWAKSMVKKFGNSIKSGLKFLWNEIQAFNKRLGRTGAISGRPAGKMATRPAEMKDFKWNKENYRVVHLEYTSPYTGVVSRVAKLLKVDNKWEWVGTNRAFLTLATATKTVRSEIFEKLRNTERQQEKIQKVAADKKARQTVKVEKFLSQPSPSETTTSKDLPQTITAKIERFADRVTRALADRRLALKKYQELIELNRGQPLPDWENPYERFDTLDGRVEAAKDEFKEKHWKPLQDFLNEKKISYKDFNSFVYAMHAKERNDYINSINPAFRERGIPGSGWSDKKAEEVKKDLFSRFKEETLMEAGKMFWSMHKELLNEQVKYGLLDEETKDIIEKKYQYYTPLKKIRDNTVLLDQRALGMRSEAEHQLMFSLAAIDTTFGRGEYNRVMQSLARLILLNPAPEIYEMQKDKLKPFFDERTGEVDYRLDIYADRENTVHAKFFGRDVSVVIKDPDLLSAIKSKSSVEAEKLFRLIRPLNKVMSAVNTAWSPDFILTNIARDVQTAFAHAAIVNSADMAKKILKSVPASVKTAYQYHQGVKNAETALYKEFIREGGKTGYNDIYQLQAMAEKLEKQMNERMADGAWFKTKEGIAKVASLVSAANDIAESATRFSGYKTAVEAGLSKQKAAAFAKNLTVNFNKRGTYGTLVNSLYVFGNAALQGSFLTAKLTYRMAKSEKGRIALGSMIALGTAMDVLNRLLSGYDEEEGKSYYDKIDASFKDNNLIIMLSDGYYFSLPLAYGLNVLPALGRNVSAYLFGDQTLRETGNNIIGTGMAAFNPMGNDNRGFLFNLLPSAARPFFDLKTNSKWTGKKIKPDQPLFGADLPQSQLFYDQTNKHLVKFTQWLNEAFGGNKIDSAGWPVDLSPADIQHLLETFAGGVGKTVMRTTDSIARLVNGEPVPVENLPIIRRFAGKAKDYNVYDDFRENAQIALRVQRAKSGKDLDWLRNNRESVAVADVYKKAQKTIEKINDNGRMTDQEKEAELLSEKKRFNKKVRDIMQKNLSKN